MSLACLVLVLLLSTDNIRLSATLLSAPARLLSVAIIASLLGHISALHRCGLLPHTE